MSDELAAEEFDKHPENDVVFGGYVFRLYKGVVKAKYADQSAENIILHGIKCTVDATKGWNLTRGWKTEAQHFQDTYGSRGIAVPDEAAQAALNEPDFIYRTNSCTEHEMVHGGGKTQWCRHCDYEQQLNSGGVWV